MDAWLYIVLLGAAIWVYARLLPKSSGTAAPADMMKEIEDTIDHFSSEIEEENRQLMKLVSGLKSEHESQVQKLLNRIELLERQGQGLTEQVSEMAKVRPAVSPSTPAAAAQTRVAAESASGAKQAALPNTEAAQDAASPRMNIRSRYAELFKLQGEGKSTEFIAKKLGMNKGEVMLIMQLGKQEDGARA